MEKQNLQSSKITVVQNIESLIFEIRGKQVMLDKDLAMLYGVPTKRLNEQVRRNIERFPDDFMFQLTKNDIVISRSQFATLNEKRRNLLLTLKSTTNSISRLKF